MEQAELRLECLKLAASPEMDVTLARAKRYFEFVVGAGEKAESEKTLAATTNTLHLKKPDKPR
jgi:hypothetical protein